MDSWVYLILKRKLTDKQIISYNLKQLKHTFVEECRPRRDEIVLGLEIIEDFVKENQKNIEIQLDVNQAYKDGLHAYYMSKCGFYPENPYEKLPHCLNQEISWNLGFDNAY